MILTDNETKIDLLNNEAIATTIVRLLRDHPDRPMTIGVHGDWGAGKSSVLEMIEASFESEKTALCLKFNGWRFQGFEDAKIALIEGIVTAARPRFQPHRPLHHARSCGQASATPISPPRARRLPQVFDTPVQDRKALGRTRALTRADVQPADAHRYVAEQGAKPRPIMALAGQHAPARDAQATALTHRGHLARIIHEKCAIKAKPLISLTTMRMGCLMKFFAMKSLAQVFGGLGRFRAVR